MELLVQRCDDISVRYLVPGLSFNCSFSSLGNLVFELVPGEAF